MLQACTYAFMLLISQPGQPIQIKDTTTRQSCEDLKRFYLQNTPTQLRVGAKYECKAK